MLGTSTSFGSKDMYIGSHGTWDAGFSFKWGGDPTTISRTTSQHGPFEFEHGRIKHGGFPLTFFELFAFALGYEIRLAGGPSVWEEEDEKRGIKWQNERARKAREALESGNSDSWQFITGEDFETYKTLRAYYEAEVRADAEDARNEADSDIGSVVDKLQFIVIIARKVDEVDKYKKEIAVSLLSSEGNR